MPLLPGVALPPELSGIPSQVVGKRHRGEGEGLHQPRTTSSGPNCVQTIKIGTHLPSLPQIWITTTTKRTTALIDTAATANFLRADFLSSHERRHLTPYDQVVRQANADDILRIEGQVTTTIRIGKSTIPTTFLVAPDIEIPVILGQPWLDDQAVVIDYATHSIQYGQGPRHRAYWADAPPPPKLHQINPTTINHDLGQQEAAQLLAVLNKHAAVFDTQGPLKQTSSAEHRIQLAHHKPICVRPYRFPPDKAREIEEQVAEMKADGIVEPSDSPYNSPIVLVSKKDGGKRFCVDYRQLNQATHDEPAPEPHLPVTLKDLGQARVFSTLDLKSGYWQIPVAPESRPLTAFTTPSGESLQFTAMPFGLKNAPRTFQKMMATQVLVGLQGRFCTAYLDDVIVYSPSWEEHLNHLDLVLSRLEQHNLTCSPSKCHFGQSTITYLGHEVTSEGNAPLPATLTAIRDAPPPRTRRQLRAFLGLCNWVREFVPRMAEIMAPLTALLTKNTKYLWTSTHQTAFDALREACSSAQPLARPDPHRPLILQTDASSTGMGAVLFQEKPNGEPSVISYASAYFGPVERKYSSNEQECLAVVWAIKKYRYFLESRPFVLRTDNRALTWLHTMKDMRNKLGRWALLLQEFSYTVEHVPGKSNTLPDALSRNPSEGPPPPLPEPAEPMWPPSTTPLTIPEDRLRTLQQLSPLDYVKQAQQTDSQTQRYLRNPTPRHLVKDGLLWEQGVLSTTPPGLYVPPTARDYVLAAFHDAPLSGHPGTHETLRAIRTQFQWPGMSQDVRRYVSVCRVCACAKQYSQPKAEQRPRQPEGPWHTVAVDIMGPYPRSNNGKRFLLVITDLYSRWVEAFPLTRADAKQITNVMEKEIFARYGYPRHVLSDNGVQFTGKVWTQACQRWDVDHWTTPIYHPRANPTERRNKDIKQGLRIRLGEDHRTWDLYVPEILFTLRYRENSATGAAPSLMFLGRPILKPGEWKFQLAKDANYVGQPVGTNQVNTRYQLGDPVYVKTHPLSNAPEFKCAGFEPRWSGPGKVERVRGTVYWVRVGRKVMKVHQDCLRPCPSTSVETVQRDVGSSSQTSSPPLQAGSQQAAVTVPAPRQEPGTPSTSSGDEEKKQQAGQPPDTSPADFRRHQEVGRDPSPTGEPFKGFAPPVSRPANNRFGDPSADALAIANAWSGVPGEIQPPRPRRKRSSRRRGRRPQTPNVPAETSAPALTTQVC